MACGAGLGWRAALLRGEIRDLGGVRTHGVVGSGLGLGPSPGVGPGPGVAEPGVGPGGESGPAGVSTEGGSGPRGGRRLGWVQACDGFRPGGAVETLRRLSGRSATLPTGAPAIDAGLAARSRPPVRPPAPGDRSASHWIRGVGVRATSRWAIGSRTPDPGHRIRPSRPVEWVRGPSAPSIRSWERVGRRLDRRNFTPGGRVVPGQAPCICSRASAPAHRVPHASCSAHPTQSIRSGPRAGHVRWRRPITAGALAWPISAGNGRRSCGPGSGGPGRGRTRRRGGRGACLVGR